MALVIIVSLGIGFLVASLLYELIYAHTFKSMRDARREWQEARDDLLSQQQHAAGIRDGYDA